MKLSALRSEITDEGTWTELPEFRGVSVCVRTTDHPEYTRDINMGLERRSRAARKDPNVRNEIVMRAVAKHLLLDWKGVTDDDDAAVPFERDTVVGWAKDLRNYGRFLGAVLSASVQVTEELAEAREDLGNG